MDKNKSVAWQVLLLYVWGNEIDGYEVSNMSPIGTYLDLDDNAQDSEILALLCEKMGGDPNALGIDQNMDTTDEMHVIEADTGRPVCVLRRVRK